MGNWFYNIFGVAGLGLLIFGVYSFVNTTIYLNTSTTIEGTVVGVQRKSVDMDHGLADFPTVRFVTKDGRSIVFTSNTG